MMDFIVSFQLYNLLKYYKDGGHLFCYGHRFGCLVNMLQMSSSLSKMCIKTNQVRAV